MNLHFLHLHPRDGSCEQLARVLLSQLTYLAAEDPWGLALRRSSIRELFRCQPDLFQRSSGFSKLVFQCQDEAWRCSSLISCILAV